MAFVYLASNKELSLSGSGEVTWGIPLSDVADEINKTLPDKAIITHVWLYLYDGTAYNNNILDALNEYAICGLTNSDSDAATSTGGGTGGTNLIKYGPFEIGGRKTVNIPKQTKLITDYFNKNAPYSVQNTSYSRLSVAFTSKAIYNKKYTFSLALEVFYEIPHTHSYTSEVTTAATCTTAGVRTYTCDCDDSYTESIPALGHSFGSTTAAKAATCTSAGNSAYKYCSTCKLYFAGNAATNSTAGKSAASAFTISALGHSFGSTTAAKAATCTSAGNSAYKKCSTCNLYFAGSAATNATGGNSNTSSFTIAALGHSFGSTTAAKAATCTSAGNSAYKKCSTCNLYFDGSAATNSTAGKSATSAFTINALGHAYATTFTIDKKATCTTDGSKSKHCSRCSSTTEVTTITKRGHSLIDNGVATPATCIAAGVMNQKCTNTATTEYDACSYTTTRSIPATGHTEVADAAVAATCTTAGKTAGSHCSICNAIITAQTTIPAKGHTSVADAAVAATCTTAGKTAGSHCSVCNTILTAQQTIAALGHNMSDYVQTKAPTYSETGEQRSDCSRCDHYNIKTIAALGFPVYINVEQVKGIYYVESEKTIYFVISGDISTGEPGLDAVDEIHFKTTNTVPANGKVITGIYISDSQGNTTLL